MLYSIVSYTGDGSTKTFSVPFPYLAKAHVEVRVGGILKTYLVDYTFVTSSTIQFNVAPTGTIKIQRNTPKNARSVDYQDGTILTEATMDADANQLFYIEQEILDSQVELSNGTDLTQLQASLSQAQALQAQVASLYTTIQNWIAGQMPPAASLYVNADNYTVTSGVHGQLIRMDYATLNKVRIPTDSLLNLAIGTQFAVVQEGLGMTYIEPAPGVTINSPASLNLRTRNSMVALVKVAANKWDLTGDVQSPDFTFPVTSVNGLTGAVNIDIGVKTINGQSGDVSLPVGGGGVTSVNGQTGAVNIVAGVSSVNGQTGAVNVAAEIPTTRNAVGTYGLLYFYGNKFYQGYDGTTYSAEAPGTWQAMHFIGDTPQALCIRTA